MFPRSGGVTVYVCSLDYTYILATSPTYPQNRCSRILHRTTGVLFRTSRPRAMRTTLFRLAFP
jgi:hypothetical protein